MGRLRSFIILLVIGIPLFWYTYRESKKGPVDDTPKHDKVFSVDASKIDEIEVKSESGERTTLQRKGSDWTIVQPAPAPTDQATVSGITSNLASMEIQRVIEENPGDVAEFGLATPRVEVAFKAGGQQHRLQIGQKTPAGTDVYARLADQKRVFLVSSISRVHFQQKLLRPSRQVGPEGRSRKGRFPRGHDGRTRDEVREIERRMGVEERRSRAVRSSAPSTGSCPGLAVSR